ncbi:MAG TPA: transglycosylase SLT domain-containing protein [Polyangiaceae bacterium]|nr:transglycosylase SLT domain-containing protein [Polyangiaceae bacterium]
MSIEKFVSYPLALLGSLALLSPATDMSKAKEIEGASSTETHRLESGVAAGASAAVGKHPVHGRSSAESAELRALRAAEGALFPELGASELDLRGASLPTASCESPDHEFSKSATMNVTPAGEWLRGLERPEIAVPRDPKVARYIRFFGAHPKGREAFSQWLRRSGAYRDIVETALAKRRLPRDLMAVMFVESGCIPKATSIAGAAGLWQFMPQTARAYGLKVQSDYDERRNTWRATEAAVAHLADLYAQFESWHLALAAYNMGYQQLLDRLTDTGAEDFFALSNIAEALPRETLLYVPKILAVAVILRNLAYFGFDGVEKAPALSASRIEVPPGTRMALVARAAGTSLRKLSDLNAHIIGDAVPDLGAPAYVFVPSSGLARAKSMLPRLLNEQTPQPLDLEVTADFDWGREEFDMNWRSRLEQTKPPPEASDKEKPKTRTEKRTWRSKLETPQRERESAWGYADPAAKDMSIKETVTLYRVRRGDTLSGIASQFRISKQALAEANGLTTQSHVRAGAKLRIVTPSPSNG